MKHKRVILFLNVFAFLLFAVPRGRAQSDPTSADGSLTTDSFKLAEAPAAPDLKSRAPKDYSLTWKANAGGIVSTGNTRSIAINAGTSASWKKGWNQVSGDAQYIYGRAGVRDPATNQVGDMQTNAENFNAQARYDRYFTKYDAVFIGGKVRVDHFAGLDLRLQGQVGYLRDIIVNAGQRLWGEIGYDITYDDFYGIPGTDIVHAVRVFAGYDHHVNDYVNLLTGIEALFNVEEGKDIRVNSLTQLNSKLTDDLQLGVQFAFRFDNVPVPTAISKTDTVTTINLLYSLL